MYRSEHPPVHLWQVPDAAATEALAGHMATRLRVALAGDGRPEDATRSLGWRYCEGPIGSATSTVESLLAPLNRGGFSVVVNTHLAPSTERAMWLTAHEIGHSFFYTQASPPRRIVPVTAEEEDFCDTFATHLLRIAKRSAGINVSAA